MTAGAATRRSSSIRWTRDWHREYTSIYQVITDDLDDGPVTATNATGIPAYGSSYSWGNDSDQWAFAIEANASLVSEDNTRRQWYVTITHSTQPRLRCADVQRNSPLDEPPIISGSFVQFTKPAEEDKDGDPIVNVCDEPFIPAVEINDSRDSLVIEINTANINLAQRADAKDKVNSGTIWGLGPRTVLLKQWTWRKMSFGVCNEFINHRYEFEINTDKWNHKLHNVGYRHKNPFWVCGDDPEEQWRTILDGRDQPRHLPTPLKLDGSINDLQCGGTPVYLKDPDGFEIYKEYDLTTLPGIPDPLPGPFA